MRERGMIFNAEMVRAILDGRKTQTRRVIVPSMRTADTQFELHQQPDGSWMPMHTFNEGSFDKTGSERPIKCPFGAVGDRLWVRETWADVNHEGCPAVAYRANGEVRDLCEDDGDETDPNLEKYRFANWYPDLMSGTEGTWTPSIHMPRWASRITLEITGVRVERLSSMTEEDARAEGCMGGHDSIPGYMYSATPHEHFHHLWTSIYGEDSWQVNPWVWVVEFKRVEDEQL